MIDFISPAYPTQHLKVYESYYMTHIHGPYAIGPMDHMI